MENTFTSVRPDSKSKFAGAVFLYVFIGLAITAAVAAIMGFIFKYALPIEYSNSGFINPATQQNASTYFAVMGGATIAYFILLIWIMVGTFRGKGNMAIPFTLYAIVMGILISSFTLFVRVELIAISFGITCLIFGGLFSIGWFAKKDLSVFAMLAGGLVFGALLMSLFNIIWMFVSPATFNVMNWVISFILLIAIMLITIVDFSRIKKIEESGQGTKNLALFCAFSLYVDFIYIFIRVLIFVARASKH